MGAEFSNQLSAGAVCGADGDEEAQNNATIDESCAAEGGGPAALPPLKRADLPPSLLQIEAETDAFVAATARGEPGGALLRNATGGEGRYARGWTAALLRWFGIGR